MRGLGAEWAGRAIEKKICDVADCRNSLVTVKVVPELN
jgi:hypothetical protein